MNGHPDRPMQLEGRFWLDRDGKPFLGPGRVALLERIDADLDNSLARLFDWLRLQAWSWLGW